MVSVPRCSAPVGRIPESGAAAGGGRRELNSSGFPRGLGRRRGHDYTQPGRAVIRRRWYRPCRGGPRPAPRQVDHARRSNPPNPPSITRSTACSSRSLISCGSVIGWASPGGVELMIGSPSSASGVLTMALSVRSCGASGSAGASGPRGWPRAEGVRPRPERLERAVLRVVHPGVLGDLREVAADQREIVVLVGLADAPDALHAPSFTIRQPSA